MTVRQIGLVAGAAAIACAAYFSFFSATLAPQVQFKTLSGESISTGDLRGKVVLVEFWATSCVTCVEEMPKVIETYNKYKQQGFEMVAVAMDYDPPNHVLSYALKNALPFKVALDIKGEIARNFGDIRLTPTSFLIDKQGRIVKQYLGAPQMQEFRSLLEKKLKETA
jgi:thiol-disulfide isomerase/thioredoxin